MHFTDHQDHFDEERGLPEDEKPIFIGCVYVRGLPLPRKKLSTYVSPECISIQDTRTQFGSFFHFSSIARDRPPKNVLEAYIVDN